MIARPLAFSDLYLFNPKRFADERGCFSETFRQDWLTEALGQKVCFCQQNQVKSKQGVLRGLHFQQAPYAQAKLLQVIEGEILDVLVDLRRSSKTFGQYLSIPLNAEDQQTLYIPPGLAHGYLVLSHQACVAYQVDQYYQPSAEMGLAYKDPTLAISWPKLTIPYLISAKDQQQPTLEQLDAMGCLFE